MCNNMPVATECIFTKPVELIRHALENTLASIGVKVVCRPSIHHFVVATEPQLETPRPMSDVASVSSRRQSIGIKPKAKGSVLS